MANQSLTASLHSGGVQGHEEYVVAMFVDMRASTGLGERVLAYDVGFNDPNYFSKSFHKEFGLTPSEFRQH